MPISPGLCFDHYEIVAPLGAGGMGEVYAARDTRLHREVALKVLPADVAQEADRLRRFELEAKATSALNHPNILTVYDFGTYESAPYLVAELLEGETLRAVLQRGALPLPQALEYAQQIAQGLVAAHAKSIVHRDLKPENLFVTTNGFVKILDFGLAKLTETRKGERGTRNEEAETLIQDAPAIPRSAFSDHPSTIPGTVMGTASYMSPEQARGQDVDARSDIFSLGVVLYEMLTGDVPFAGVNALDVIGAILNQESAPLREFVPDVPAELQRIVTKALRKDREQRYQHVKDLLLDVKDLQQELEFAARLKGVQASVVPTAGGDIAADTATTAPSAEATKEVATARATSSTKIILGELKRHKLGVLLIVALLALVSGGAIYGLYKWVGPKSATLSLQAAKFTRLTSTGKATGAAISPDGKWLVYVADDGGQQSLWLRQVAVASSNTQVTPPTEALYLGVGFSPDGNYIYYTVLGKNEDTGTLYQMPVLGGVPRKLLKGITTSVTFSPDGKQIAFFQYIGDEDRLMMANADGSGARQLAVRRGKEFFYNDDSNRLCCTNQRKSTLSPELVELDLVTLRLGQLIHPIESHATH